MMDFTRLKKNLKKDFSNLPDVKVAILGDSATQLFTQAIRGYGYEAGLDLEIFEADYNQIDMQVFHASSQFYKFGAEFVIIFYSTQKLMKSFYKLGKDEKAHFADRHIEQVKDIYNTVTSNQPCRMIYINHAEICDSVFGNYSNKIDVSFVYQLRKLNYELMNLSQEYKNLFINDLSMLQSQYGNDFVFDSKIYINADMIFSLDFLPVIAKNTVDIICAIRGKFKKCLILDLDNTLWGGIVGDDGFESIQIGDLGIGKAFTGLQLWAKQLKERGIILGICSKNTESIAKEPFEKHPEMVLRLEDIAIFVANWDNKVDNIKAIQEILNIGFDSMVFLDDNAFERNMVRTYIPEITIPELPEDPAEYLGFLRKLNLFETASYTEKDGQRTKQYQQEAKRKVLRKSFTDEDAFLQSLEMVSIVKPFDKFTIPRIAQLTQRSNQFNLRTIRYTEEELEQITASNNHFGMSFTLRDKLGDYGLISVIILEKRGSSFFIDTWIMSCRVLKRKMENFVLNQIVDLAKQNNVKKLIGEYIPTPKNGLVKDHYANLGFEFEEGQWILGVDSYEPRLNSIKRKHNT